MDKSKSTSKSGMFFPTIKYNVNQDEIEEIYSSDTERSSCVEVTETSSKLKKVDKGGPSILDKYFKAFKVEKASDDDSKSENTRDILDKKSADVPCEISGSPIKEYFSKFNKRSDSTETNSELDSLKDPKDREINDRWKLFSDFKVKIVQAVEDIKSSRTSEGDYKEKPGSTDNLSDSEENSFQQDIEQNSASTENQVSSLASSIQNLSDLSNPGLSHSSTITDSEMETSSSDSHLNTTPIPDKNEDEDTKHLDPITSKSNESENLELNSDEIESGVDALEDFELLKTNTTENVTNTFKTTPCGLKNDLKVVLPQETTFFNFTLVSLTSLVFGCLILIPSFVMLNGFFIGVWFLYTLNKAYLRLLELLGYNEVLNYEIINMAHCQNLSITKVPQILEFEPIKKYEGWVNIFTFKKYDPMFYHVSLTHTVFMKLEGSTLRMSFTHSKIPKRALWNEKEFNATFYEHKICDLEGASIKLLPVGIVRKRHWSKKYPICIKLQNKSKLKVQSHIDLDTEIPKAQHSKEDGSPIVYADKTDNLLVSIEDKNSKSTDSPKHFSDCCPLPTTSDVITNTPKKNSSNKGHLVSKVKDHLKNKRKKKKLSENQRMALLVNDFLPDDTDEDDELLDEELISNSSEFEERFINKVSKNNEEFKEFFSMEETSQSKIDQAKQESINNDEILLYLFGRTGRDKAEWYIRLKNAIDEANKLKDLEHASTEGSTKQDNKEEVEYTEPVDTLEEDSSKKEIIESKVKLGSIKPDKKSTGSNDVPPVLWTPGGQTESLLADAFNSSQNIDFWKFMKNIVEQKNPKESESVCDNFLWLNAILGRMAFDTFRNPLWVAKIQERIQKKLSSLKLPSFMGPLMVTSMEMGYEAPQVHGVSAPTLDSCGLWIDFQVSYTGHATMTLTTQLNLMSLKDRNFQSEETPEVHKSPSHKKVNMAVFESDLEDTAESSSDDDADLSSAQVSKTIASSEPSPPTHLTVGNTPAKKLLRMVDKIAASKYFQHVTEYKYVKRAMEGVSNTDLKLNVELCGLVGCFTINIPPPPSDRLWFGFRGSPHVILKAKPIFGSRVINFGHVTSWIEKRLVKEFEKILVYPNLEDIVIDGMSPPVVD